MVDARNPEGRETEWPRRLGPAGPELSRPQNPGPDPDQTGHDDSAAESCGQESWPSPTGASIRRVFRPSAWDWNL